VPNGLDLPSNKVASGVVRITYAVIQQAAKNEGYTIIVDDRVYKSSVGAIAALIVAICSILLFIGTYIVMYFQYNECIWVR
jgi:hypothetical protein